MLLLLLLLLLLPISIQDNGWQWQVCWLRFFCPLLLYTPLRWYSRLYLPHFGVRVHTICWELHNQAHGILSNELSWPPCYVGANIQSMQPAVVWLTVSWTLPQTLQLLISASWRSYFDGIWYWASGPELLWSSFQFLLWVLHFLTKHNLLLCQQKVFRGCKNIVALVSHAVPSILSFSMLSFL